jgi:hypothetical protein
MINLMKDADKGENLLSTSCSFRRESELKKKEDIFKILKGKATPVTGRGGPYCSEASRLPHLLDNRRTDSGKFSALHAGHTLPPGRFLVFISIRGCVDPTDMVQLEELN